MLFGLAPALAARRIDPAPLLQADGRTVAGGGRWFRSALVVAQVAVSLVLLIAAGQFLRTVITCAASTQACARIKSSSSPWIRV